MLSEVVQQKYHQVQEILRSLQSVAVAFSAGVDSTLILKIAVETLGQQRVAAVTGQSSSLAQAEFDAACKLAQQIGARHVVLETDEFDSDAYLDNPHNRCYFCKTSLYTQLSEFIAQQGLNAIISGTNADDYGDWRPGIQAASEHHVRAPLAEAGLTKQEVRSLSEWLGLPTFDKPASPCLSSRVQYGERITAQKLQMVEAAERFLKSLGIRECRVRHHHDLARIEVHPQDIPRLVDTNVRRQIDTHFRELGYIYVTIDLRGFRSGSMNEVIALKVVN